MSKNPVSSANLMGHPVHPMLVPFPIVFFLSTFGADVAFWWTRNPGWATAASWLLGAGLVGAGAAAIAGVIDFAGDERIRKLSDAWRHAIGNVTAVLISLFSFYWRYRYGVSGVLPVGLVLSAAVAALLVYTGYKGGSLVYEHRVAVYDEPTDPSVR